jgi:eukaryotic-like serine/threonine-protein kinase
LTVDFSLYPAYLRGLAYLAARQGTAAALEFQKIPDYPGVVVNEPIGSLAYLGLGRAHVLANDLPRAKAEYETFFSIWKGADADTPLLRQARIEYEKLL